MFGGEVVLDEVKVQVGMKGVRMKVKVMEQKRTRAMNLGHCARGNCTQW